MTLAIGFMFLAEALLVGAVLFHLHRPHLTLALAGASSISMSLAFIDLDRAGDGGAIFMSLLSAAMGVFLVLRAWILHRKEVAR